MSYFPTPRARDAQAEGYEAGLKRPQPQVGTILKGLVKGDSRVLMPTPNTMDHLPARTPEQKLENKGKGGYANVRETVVNDLMPTPTAMDGNTVAKSELDANDPKHRLKVVAQVLARDNQPEGNERVLMGTPRGTAANPSKSQVETDAPKRRIEDQVLTTNWGKFEPAIRRWENLLGRVAPAPTKPDGKDGAHRLSSKLTEFMMGLPEGWITDVGLSRNDELKACGNGVVPQQAELALRILLQSHDANEV